MAKGSVTITLDPDSDLARALATAGETDVLVESRGRRYRVSPAETDSSDDERFAAARVRAVLTETAGSWADLDIDQLIADVSAARKAGSRSSDRP